MKAQTVLIVTDDTTTLQIVRLTLGSDGIRVVEAGDAVRMRGRIARGRRLLGGGGGEAVQVSRLGDVSE